MLASCSAYICACWKRVMPCSGDSMKTRTPRLPRIAYSAAEPVSPEVAPRMFSSPPVFASAYSNRLPSSCIAMSLNASVGPFDSASRCRPGSSVFSGVMSSAFSPRTGVAVDLGGVGLVDQRAQVVVRNVVDQARQHGERQFAVIHAAHRRQLGGAETRIALRHVQAAVAGQPAEQDFGEAELRCQSARAEVVHHWPPVLRGGCASPCPPRYRAPRSWRSPR